MGLTIKVKDTEYTLHNEEKKCGNCFNNSLKVDFYREHEIEQYGWGIGLEYPQYHPCKKCKDCSNWYPLMRHLYDIIEHLQEEVDKSKKSE